MSVAPEPSLGRELGRLAVLLVFGALVGFVWNPECLRGHAGTGDGASAASAPSFVPGTITLEELKPLYDRGAVVIVDARRRRAFEAGHVPGSLAALDEGGRSLLRTLRRWIPIDQPVVVLGDDRHDFAAARLAGRLRMAGIRDARALEGGISAWKDAGLPLVEGWDMKPLLLEDRR